MPNKGEARWFGDRAGVGRQIRLTAACIQLEGARVVGTLTVCQHIRLQTPHLSVHCVLSGRREAPDQFLDVGIQRRIARRSRSGHHAVEGFLLQQ